jgi:hypothetical protein
MCLAAVDRALHCLLFSAFVVWAVDNQNIIDDMPLLAKPSVRFRKTINTVSVSKTDPTQRRVMSVNAQHYAVLVTDVKQWPYPEMQWCALAG